MVSVSRGVDAGQDGEHVGAAMSMFSSFFIILGWTGQSADNRGQYCTTYTYLTLCFLFILDLMIYGLGLD